MRARRQVSRALAVIVTGLAVTYGAVCDAQFETFENADMAGTWVYTALTIDGPDDQSADAGFTIDFDAMGNVTGGVIEPGLTVTGGSYTIDAGGDVTLSVNLSDGSIVTLDAASMNIAKDVIAGEGGGSDAFGSWISHVVLVRQSGSFSNADMAGSWSYSEVAIFDDDDQSVTGGIVLQLDAMGQVTGGQVPGLVVLGGSYTISSIGEVSITINLSDGVTATLDDGAMSPSKDVIAGAGGGSEGYDVWETHVVMIRMGAGFTNADAAGTWMYSETWIEGPDDQGVEGGYLLEFDDSGNVVGGTTEPGVTVTGGTYTLTSGGGISASVNLSNGGSAWMSVGSMSPGTDVIAGTGGGTDGVDVWERHQVLIRKPDGEVLLSGDNSGDEFGFSVAGLGDVNGDGVNDFAVGMPGFNNERGRVRVFSGADFSVIWTRQGQASGDRMGHCVARSGDVNGDGKDDVIVGLPGSDLNGIDSGRVFVYSGANAGVIFQRKGRAAGDGFGWSVSGGVDVNDDGTDDVIVGAPYNDDRGTDAGLVDVLHGTSFAVMSRRKGNAAGDNFGWCVAGLENGDPGVGDEVLIGAPRNDQIGTDSGKVFVFTGGAGGLGTGFAVVGQGSGQQFGSALAALNDVDGDGYSDWAVGAPFWALTRGRVYVYRGKERLRLWIKAGPVGSHFGDSIAAAGDLDCDGVIDVLGGATANGSDAGLVRFLSGADGAALGAETGDASGDRFGQGLASLGDLNGDGRHEVIVGAPGGSPADAGEIVILSADDCTP